MSSATASKINREPGAHIAMLTTPTIGRTINGTIGTKLASLTPARDLTLGGRGGTGIAKKVFTPNLNVVRNKNTNVKTSKDTRTRGRGRGRGARGAGRGRGGRGAANSTLIQTTGLFSEGAGALHVRKGRSGISSNNRNTDETTTSMRKPLLIKHEHKLIDLKAEAALIREQLGDSEDDLLDEKTDTELIPVKLKEAKPNNMNTVIKLEKIEDKPILNGDFNRSTDAMEIAAKLHALHVKQQNKNVDKTKSPLPQLAHSLEEMFASNQTHLFVMQMPNTLPCDGEIESDDLEISISNATKDGKSMTTALPSIASTSASANAKSTNANTPASTASTGAESDAPAKSRLPVFKNHLVLANATNYDLMAMDEGQVGKVLRYKSGKVKLMLGDALFDLDMGTDPGFVQDIISISTNGEERNGNMINLGPLQAKITASPDCKYYRQDARARYGA